MCSDFWEYNRQARELAAELTERYGWTLGQTNAFRHSYGAALIAWNYGSATAKEFTNRHEWDTPIDTAWKEWDSDTDVWNNSIGIKVVERAKSGLDWQGNPIVGDLDAVTTQLMNMTSCQCAGVESWLTLGMPNLMVNADRDNYEKFVWLELDTDIQSG